MCNAVEDVQNDFRQVSVARSPTMCTMSLGRLLEDQTLMSWYFRVDELLNLVKRQKAEGGIVVTSWSIRKPGQSRGMSLSDVAEQLPSFKRRRDHEFTPRLPLEGELQLKDRDRIAVTSWPIPWDQPISEATASLDMSQSDFLALSSGAPASLPRACPST
jgi:hypothetical protein